MSFRLLETVVLIVDLPEHELRAGDLGTIVEMTGTDHLEVEFVTASGDTQALVTLESAQVRRVGDDDVIAVRRLDRSA